MKTSKKYKAEIERLKSLGIECTLKRPYGSYYHIELACGTELSCSGNWWSISRSWCPNGHDSIEPLTTLVNKIRVVWARFEDRHTALKRAWTSYDTTEEAIRDFRRDRDVALKELNALRDALNVMIEDVERTASCKLPGDEE